jgi:hypothetical protein
VVPSGGVKVGFKFVLLGEKVPMFGVADQEPVVAPPVIVPCKLTGPASQLKPKELTVMFTLGCTTIDCDSEDVPQEF